MFKFFKDAYVLLTEAVAPNCLSKQLSTIFRRTNLSGDHKLLVLRDALEREIQMLALKIVTDCNKAAISRITQQQKCGILQDWQDCRDLKIKQEKSFYDDVEAEKMKIKMIRGIWDE
jgi:hypothetical protein